MNTLQLLELIRRYVIEDDGRKLTTKPFIITVGDKTYRLQDGSLEIEDCNHEEADTRLVLTALKLETDVVVVAKDTDVIQMYSLREKT